MKLTYIDRNGHIAPYTLQPLMTTMSLLLQNVLYTQARLFAGDRIYMRDHSGVADDNGPGVDRLADGPGMEAGPIRSLH